MSIVSYPQVKKRESFKIIFNGIKFVCPLWFLLSLLIFDKLRVCAAERVLPPYLKELNNGFTSKDIFLTFLAKYPFPLNLVKFHHKLFLVLGHINPSPVPARFVATPASKHFNGELFFHWNHPTFFLDFFIPLFCFPWKEPWHLLHHTTRFSISLFGCKPLFSKFLPCWSKWW